MTPAMMNSRLVALAVLAVFESASAVSSSSFDTGTSTIPETSTHTVAVGKNGFTFAPDTTYASPGDTIEFRFYPLNHSVVQAFYGSPCIPIELSGPGRRGFHSGFKPIDTISDDPPAFSIVIGNMSPIFFYCGAPNSCIGNGMVGAINPTENQTLSHQRMLAENSSFMLNPGDSWPSEETSPLSSLTPTSTPTATVTNIPGSPTAAASHKDGLAAGAIISTVIGILTAAILIAGLLGYFCFLRRKAKDETTPYKPRPAHISYPSISRPLLSYTGPGETVETPFVQPIYPSADITPTLHRTPSEHRKAEALKRLASLGSEQSLSVYESRSGVSTFTASLARPRQIKDYSMFDGSKQWQ